MNAQTLRILMNKKKNITDISIYEKKRIQNVIQKKKMIKGRREKGEKKREKEKKHDVKDFIFLRCENGDKSVVSSDSVAYTRHTHMHRHNKSR